MFLLSAGQKKLVPAVLACITLLLFNPSGAKARVYLDITSAEFHKLPIAVPYFLDKKNPGQTHETDRKMADLLSRALNFHGFIKIVSPLTYGGRQDSDWETAGVDFTVLGQYDTTPSGIVLELRLVDTKGARMILGRRYRGAWSKHRQMVLRFCDEIILKLSGERGISLSKIAFVSDQAGHKEIYLSDILGDQIRQVTRHGNLAVSPRFSPNGAKLAYTSYHRGNPDLYVTDLSQNKITKAISWHKGLNMAPAWSPNGNTMLVTLSKDNNPDLYLIRTNGKIIRRLTENTGISVSPSWAPDGKHFAFVSDRTGKPQIYIMELWSGKVKRLTYEGRENTTPNWSPKGDWIAYTGDTQYGHHIFIISPDGGRPIQVTKSWGNHESPSWSPDGRQLVFSRRRNDNQKLCAIFRNGRGLRVLFPMPGNQSGPQWSPRLQP